MRSKRHSATGRANVGDQDAYFDVLSICDRLRPTLGPVAPAEVHLLAYLGCLLALYRGRAVGRWGCTFAATEEGYPYSPDVQAALGTLIRRGDLATDSDGFLTVTSSGERELGLLRSLAAFQEREEYLGGACGSTLALPTGTIREAVAFAPDVRGALRTEQSRLLLTKSGLDRLYEQFATLGKVVGVDVADPMVPAVVWLTYILEVCAKRPTSHPDPAHVA